MVMTIVFDTVLDPASDVSKYIRLLTCTCHCIFHKNMQTQKYFHIVFVHVKRQMHITNIVLCTNSFVFIISIHFFHAT